MQFSFIWLNLVWSMIVSITPFSADIYYRYYKIYYTLWDQCKLEQWNTRNCLVIITFERECMHHHSIIRRSLIYARNINGTKKRINSTLCIHWFKIPSLVLKNCMKLGHRVWVFCEIPASRQVEKCLHSAKIQTIVADTFLTHLKQIGWHNKM